MNSASTLKKPLVKNEGLSFSSTLKRHRKCAVCKTPFHDTSRTNVRKWCSDECKKEGLRLAKKEINKRNYRDRCLLGKSGRVLARCKWCDDVNRTDDPLFCSAQCEKLDEQFQAHVASGVFW